MFRFVFDCYSFVRLLRMLHYSQIANLGLRMDCNTFWKLLELAKITKRRPSGPFIYHKNTLKISENMDALLLINGINRLLKAVSVD